MSGLSWESMVAALGLAIPVGAAMWEFGFAGRKRLGYRVQMDTTAKNADTHPHAGVLRQMQQNGTSLLDPSFVLLRIQNSGWTHIDANDYVVRDDDQVGIRINFPGRRVDGMVVTELSHDYLRPCFDDAAGLRMADGQIELPRVPLNRGTHYKVLAVLERDPDFPTGQDFPDPVVVAGIKGGVRGGRIKKTESHTFASRPVMVFIALLVLVAAAQSFTSFTRDDAPAQAAPVDCAAGTLTLSGSTAFRAAVADAAKRYVKKCTDARITITDDTFKGSVAGLDSLEAAGKKRAGTTTGEAADTNAGAGGPGLPDRLAFTDGAKGDGRPRLLPRPVALSLFTLAVNKDTGVQDLSLKQLRQIYSGDITNWRQVNGNDVPIHLVSRHPGSGTRSTLVQQVLAGKELLEVTSGDCASMDRGRPGRCEVGDTATLLDNVASIPGALGHSEAGAALTHEGVQQVRISGYPATVEGADAGAYPYWQTEFAYTYGEPPADSVAAGFLRYLTEGAGKDSLPVHGHRPCSELEKPLLCRPAD
ncbi:substrate-binding domain-containing protein [Streptomyces longisporoflavus]|uniref:substrate-binding domain-containing protein n=1 Tax=Streptomyces longisporoflavus TaxID=28044 RepID=UPI00167DD040|nr:substrate-binding domain-containing protein [Streptomyces longisporoflavus]